MAVLLGGLAAMVPAATFLRSPALAVELRRGRGCLLGTESSLRVRPECTLRPAETISYGRAGNASAITGGMSEASHILVVDDDREIRKLLGEYLEKNGYRATAVADGKAMRKHLEQSHVDL